MLTRPSILRTALASLALLASSRSIQGQSFEISGLGGFGVADGDGFVCQHDYLGHSIHRGPKLADHASIAAISSVSFHTCRSTRTRGERDDQQGSECHAGSICTGRQHEERESKTPDGTSEVRTGCFQSAPCNISHLPLYRYRMLADMPLLQSIPC